MDILTAIIIAIGYPNESNHHFSAVGSGEAVPKVLVFH